MIEEIKTQTDSRRHNQHGSRRPTGLHSGCALWR